MRRLLVLLFATTALVAASAQSALAADANEPNDTWAQATGPLPSAAPVAGELASTSDADFFYFNVAHAGAVTVYVSGDDTCTSGAVSLLGADGGSLSGYASDIELDASLSVNAPAAGQYGVRVAGSAGCTYTVAATPADLVTEQSPGVVAELRPTAEDTVERVLVDGNPAGEVSYTQGAWLSLGVLPDGARITFEAQNPSGGYRWNARITNTVGHQTTTLLDEFVRGGIVGPGHPARIGIVRHVVLAPSGTVLESCGESLAPTTCFPVDNDADGVADNEDRCPTSAGPAALQGCPDRDGDGVADVNDHCPTVAGSPAARGCIDADADGVSDASDLCLGLAGPAHGVPAAAQLPHDRDPAPSRQPVHRPRAQRRPGLRRRPPRDPASLRDHRELRQGDREGERPVHDRRAEGATRPLHGHGAGDARDAQALPRGDLAPSALRRASARRTGRS